MPVVHKTANLVFLSLQMTVLHVSERVHKYSSFSTLYNAFHLALSEEILCT